MKHTAAFLAVAIWADGVYADEEKEVLTDIAEALQVDCADLTKNVEEALKVLEDKDGKGVEDYLTENASAIEEEDAKTLLQCAIEIVLADNVITADEVQVLFDLADATGIIEHTDVTLMLLDLVKYDPDTEIQFTTANN